MVIEYLIVDDKYKSVLPDVDLFSKEIKLSKRSYSFRDNFFLLQIKCSEDGLAAAKELSLYNEAVLQVLGSNSVKYQMIINEASNCFETELYPLLAEFETKLRKLITVALFNVDKQARSRIDKAIGKDENYKPGDINSYLEQSDLNTIGNFLFLNDELVGEINQLKKSDIAKIASRDKLIDFINNSNKKSIWEEFFAEKCGESILPESFDKIREYRNDVMHFHTIGYERFELAKTVIEVAIKDIEKLLNKKIIIDDSDANVAKISNNSAYLSSIFEMSARINNFASTFAQIISAVQSPISQETLDRLSVLTKMLVPAQLPSYKMPSFLLGLNNLWDTADDKELNSEDNKDDK